jgi:hypothetical protein
MSGIYGVSPPAPEQTILDLKQRCDPSAAAASPAITLAAQRRHADRPDPPNPYSWLAKILERGTRASRWADTLQIAARRLDADEDGKLAHSQFHLLVKTTGNCFAPAEASRLCAALDATGSGARLLPLSQRSLLRPLLTNKLFTTCIALCFLRRFLKKRSGLYGSPNPPSPPGL